MTFRSRPGLWLAAAVIVLALLVRPQHAWSASCADVAERGVFNVLTINLLFNEVGTRDERLASIAAFAASHDVHVLLLQEVVAGRLAGTENSARDLQGILREQEGLEYELRTAFEAGPPRILAVANATLSRCEILTDAIAELPVAEQIRTGRRTIDVVRNAIWTRLEIPGVRPVSVYNTHLCSGCSPAQKADQLHALLAFVDQTEQALDGPVVLGGDFNIDPIGRPGHRPLYDEIIDAGFVDAHAEVVGQPLETLCPNPLLPDEHCTLGVGLDAEALEGQLLTLQVPVLAYFGVDLSFKLPSPAISTGRRIDFVFAQGFDGVREGRVVFNARVDDDAPAVSDHAGVFASFALPDPAPHGASR